MDQNQEHGTFEVDLRGNASDMLKKHAGAQRAQVLTDDIINRIFHLTRGKGIPNCEDATVHFCASHLLDMIREATDETLMKQITYGQIGIASFHMCPSYILNVVVLHTYIRFDKDGNFKEETEMFKMLIDDVIPKNIEAFIPK